MNRNHSIILATVSGIAAFINLLLLIFGLYVGMYPDDARKKFGDQFMTWFVSLPLPIIIAILIILLTCCILFSLWAAGIFNKKSETIPSQPTPITNQQIINDSATGLQNPTFNGPVNFGQLEDKKKDEFERLSKPKFTFHYLSWHDELLIKNATVEQFLIFIKNDISAGWWYTDVINIGYKIRYSVDAEQTIFYSPEKDNVDIPGFVFHGIKSKLVDNNKGGVSSSGGSHISNFFTISVEEIGLGDNVKLLVKFDTHEKDACGFFYHMQERLKKKSFKIKLQEGRERRMPQSFLTS